MTRTAPAPNARTVLFLMHVDWRWIKQRPHFLAEQAMAAGHQVAVLFKPNRRRLRLPRNASPVARHGMLPVPHSARHGSVSRWGRKAQRAYLAAWGRRLRPSVLYVSHPLLWAVVPNGLRASAQVVYDCMDDAAAMARPEERAELERLEADLVEHATVVVASSSHLVAQLVSRHPDLDVGLVRNGLSDDMPPASAFVVAPPGARTATYLGTIAHWLDWDALSLLAEGFLGTVQLVGPRPTSTPLPRGIVCPGPVEHSRVADVLRDSDVLLLPFKPSAVVSAVDPVKLYEYVAARRPIVARYFPELERFRPFVSFYEDPATITDSVSAALSQPLPSMDEVEEFLQHQRWSDRWASIEAALERHRDRPDP